MCHETPVLPAACSVDMPFIAGLAPRRIADTENAMTVELVPNNENYRSIYPESEGTFHENFSIGFVLHLVLRLMFCTSIAWKKCLTHLSLSH